MTFPASSISHPIELNPCRQAVIQVQDLSKQYGQLTALQNINFAVYPGEIFGLIGPDGAGKTTTFHILSGVVKATAGKVEVLNHSPRQSHSHVGYLTQQFSLYLDLSVYENLRYCAGLREVPEPMFIKRSSHYLYLMGLNPFKDRLAGHLSGGMKQKLALCCVLIARPSILLLDEPTTGVDPVSRREFWDVLSAVAAEGITIMVATPYLDEAERCDRIALIHNGQIQQIGSLTELRSNLGLHRLELRTQSLPAVEEILSNYLNQNSTIVDIQPFGDRLDVLVKETQSGETEIRQLLANQACPVRIEAVEATLENIFITRLRQQQSDPPFIPYPRSKGMSYLQSTKCELPAAIAAYNLQKVFNHFQAVKNINLEIRYGEIYGLLGANGAGKTTTIKMLCGLVEASAGKIVLAGESRNLRSSNLRRRIGYMSQKFTLYDDLSILQNLEFYCRVYGVPRKLHREKIDWVLKICGLVGEETLLTGKLPGGWKQRIALGASILHEPEILFLDEPTSGVDPLARRQFWHLINDIAHQGTAVLVTTHYLEEAEHCHRIGFMVDGQIITQGSPSEIKADQPGQLIELAAEDPYSVAQVLKTQFKPWQVSIFGDHLHVVLENPEEDLLLIEKLMRSCQFRTMSWRSIPFSLEDAFIGIFQRAKVINNCSMV
jgi:ABC-2 type transport system ATP-binding protein